MGARPQFREARCTQNRHPVSCRTATHRAAPIVAPLDAVAAGLKIAAETMFEQRREAATRRQLIIDANSELKEREIIKRSSLTDAIAAALHDRGVDTAAATLVASAATTIFRVAFAQWTPTAKSPWRSSSTMLSRSSATQPPANDLSRMYRGADDPHLPISQGWLRASHHTLDPGRPRPVLPAHRHDRIEPLEPGTVHEVGIEILPTLPAGHTLALDVQPHDYVDPGIPAGLTPIREQGQHD